MYTNKKFSTNSEDCINCGICTENCIFLDKYKVDISDIRYNPELSYSCFLCGKCTRVCPIDIDGREIIYQIRKEEMKKYDKLIKKDYKMLIAEKNNYKFKNYKHSSKSVLFPGCNFPSFYPKTTKNIIEILNEHENIGVVYDCCGKPISELGMEKEEKDILLKLNQRFKEENIEELIIICPNCYHYLYDKVDINIVSIYEKLLELNIGKKIAENINMFVPCPEREEKKWMEQIKLLIDGEINYISEIQCCGLGGSAIIKEPELAKKMNDLTIKYEEIYTYCATCVGQFTRNKHDKSFHILSEILEVSEKADIKKSLINRVKTKFY
ncbi:(Fe-S)-binding protein [Miniphocaeibacter massiliensis]|uniref:(Fe-S)-binding protein n=1 Tax=Miniphocaeibacter massiliensis TaxID=2041841 RepID=UPI000C079F8D|nr:(Fe-S)-binding protein [Miniphocaeibacter massiliensis]